MMQTIRLTGLDVQDPLAFLAALGTLLAVTDQCVTKKLPTPRMSFTLGARFEAVLHAAVDNETLLDLLTADLAEVAGRGEGPRDRFLTFSYPDEKGRPIRDLKPPLQHFREFVHAQIEQGRQKNRRTIDWAAAALTDVAKDNNGNGKPFALHFTAGNQRFLVIANELLDGAGKKSAQRAVDRKDLEEAVFGPWSNSRALKVFSWSPTQDRPYALRAIDPAKDPKRGTPGADWLALRGIGLLSSAPVGSKIATSGVHGRWKSATFSYPIWTDPLNADQVRMLVRHPAVSAKAVVSQTLPRNVQVLTCQISRTDQGGYGSFSRPSQG